ncbi:MAG: aminopeptidase P family protein [Bacteroidales bacterium]|nr:aminopeptidase P family protein [Bacteroidales bacterium]MBN2756788.1 aminopeptidase P family protein [Bacteroidales bacterium]
MFKEEVYKNRRQKLKEKIGTGILLFLGNTEAAFNYPSNTYSFRQDSDFLYFFGLDQPDLAGIIDIDTGEDYIFGNDFELDDIIWMGPQASVKDRAARVGVKNTGALKNLEEVISIAAKKGQKIHILPQYRNANIIKLADLLSVSHDGIKTFVSLEFIKAVISLRSIKDEYEIVEIEKAIETAHLMHTTSMKMAMPGTIEQKIAGTIEGIALSGGGSVSFPVILSTHGETLHNHHHNNILETGRMMVTDAGCETALHYASDITRTVPVGGKFNQRQKEIYEIVLKANLEVINNSKPDVFYKDMHLLAAKTIASGLKELGLMKGNIDEAVNLGAHALFMPHGLGHMMGLDVHDMEGLGENYVGYDEEVQRSEQFGLAFLRLAKRLKKGYVLTDEPGIYFIPALIDLWKKENKFTDFINYSKLESYKDFGGIRIEDDLLITDNGCKVLGKPIPKTVAEIEETMKKNSN